MTADANFWMHAVRSSVQMDLTSLMSVMRSITRSSAFERRGRRTPLCGTSSWCDRVARLREDVSKSRSATDSWLAGRLDFPLLVPVGGAFSRALVPP